MDIVEVARRGGLSRSEKKRAASSRNLAKARAKTAAALAAYDATRGAKEFYELETAAAASGQKLHVEFTDLHPTFVPTLLTGNGSK